MAMNMRCIQDPFVVSAFRRQTTRARKDARTYNVCSSLHHLQCTVYIHIRVVIWLYGEHELGATRAMCNKKLIHPSLIL